LCHAAAVSRTHPRLGDLVPTPVFVMQPFTRQAGLASGLTDRRMQGAEYRRLFFGVYVHRDAPASPALWAQGAKLIAPQGAFAAYQTAARILGGIVPHTPDTHLGSTGRGSMAVRGLRLHVYAVPPPLVDIDGLPVTSPAQTFADLSRVLGLVDLVVLGDSLVHAGRITPADLSDAMEQSRVPRLARLAAAYVRAGAESPGETRMRMLYRLAGLPEPRTQVVVDRDNGRSFRLDIGWDEVQAGSEYDGAHHDDPAQAELDGARRDELADLGWRYTVVRASGIHATPGETISRMWALLQERGMRVGRLKQGWQTHFPGYAARPQSA